MESLVLVVQPPSFENTLKEAFTSFEDLEYVEFQDAREAKAWVESGGRKVDVALLAGDAWAFADLIQALHSSGASALVYLYLLPERVEGMKALGGLNACVDSLLVKPYFAEALKHRVSRQLKPSGAARASALLLSTGGEEERGLPQWLAQCGLLKFYSVSDGKDALEVLSAKAQELALLIVDSADLGADATLLAVLCRETARLGTGLLIQTPQESVERIRALQAVEAHVRGIVTPSRDPQQIRAQLGPILERVMKRWKADRFTREARMFLKRGNPEHAESILSHATEALPDMPEVFALLGDVLAAQGRPDPRALEAYGAALALEPLSDSLQRKFVAACLEAGKKHEAIRALKARLQRFAFDDERRLELAKLFLESGDSGAACIELRRALNVNPKNAAALRALEAAEPGVPCGVTPPTTPAQRR